ncbi:hypothetical protein OH687_03655 [Burkholderia anthina]|nr:hypothetical protein OH687_03655 [Burkholderia anthina]
MVDLGASSKVSRDGGARRANRAQPGGKAVGKAFHYSFSRRGGRAAGCGRATPASGF